VGEKKKPKNGSRKKPPNRANGKKQMEGGVVWVGESGKHKSREKTLTETKINSGTKRAGRTESAPSVALADPKMGGKKNLPQPNPQHHAPYVRSDWSKAGKIVRT